MKKGQRLAAPLLDRTAHHEPFHTKLMAAIEQVIHPQAFILASKMSKFEEREISYCQTRSAISRYDVRTFGGQKGSLGGSRG
jgi:hypothetical protein